MALCGNCTGDQRVQPGHGRYLLAIGEDKMTTDVASSMQAATMSTPIGPLTLLMRDGRVCAGGFTGDLGLVGASQGRALGEVRIELVDDLGPISEALMAYFSGDVGALDRIEVDVQGGPFQQRAWRALRSIPPGQPATYRELAIELGGARLARAVGMANATNPCAPIVPCHRLVGSDGKLTGYYWGLERKQWLLDHERRHSQSR